MKPDDSVRIDLERLRNMAGGCGWSLADFVDFYAPRARREADAVVDARDAQDRAGVARLAHGAAGSSASAGLTSLSERYRRLSESAASEPSELVDALLADAREHLARVLARLEEMARESP